MIKKLMLVPYFGPFPVWIDKYQKNIQYLTQYGYDWFFLRDLDIFCDRIKAVLGKQPTIQPETSIPHNFRSAYGLLFEKELKGYDYWGITDLDCIYGKIIDFMPDQKLSSLDIWSNHHNYICGPWTLFKNSETVNNLFRLVPNWQDYMFDTHAQPGRWTEVQYSQMIDQQHENHSINRLYTHFQGKNPDIWHNLSQRNEQLFDQEDEIMMFHFNHSKQWPTQL